MNQQQQPSTPRTPRKAVAPAEPQDIIEGEYVSQSEPMDTQTRMMILQQNSFMTRAQTTAIDWKKAKAEISAQAAEFPEGMLKCIYNKPVGTLPDRCGSCKLEIKRTRNDIVTTECPKCRSKNIILGGMQFAQGLSVYAAETLDAILGFSETTMELEEIDDGKRVRVICTYTDYRSCRRRREEIIVSRWKTARSGGGYLEPEDKFYNMTLKAAASKLKRELILRALPGPIRSWVFDMVQKIAETTANIDTDTYNKIVTAFKNEQVNPEDLGLLLGKKFDPKTLTKSDVVSLKTLYQTCRAEDSRADFFNQLAMLREEGFKAPDQTDENQGEETPKLPKTQDKETGARAVEKTEPNPETPKQTTAGSTSQPDETLAGKKVADNRRAKQGEATAGALLGNAAATKKQPAQPKNVEPEGKPVTKPGNLLPLPPDETSQVEPDPDENQDSGTVSADFDPVAEREARENDLFQLVKTATTRPRCVAIIQQIEDDDILTREQKEALIATMRHRAADRDIKL